MADDHPPRDGRQTRERAVPELDLWAQSAAATFDRSRARTEVVDEVLAAVFPDYSDDRRFIDLLRSSVGQNLDALAAWLSGDLGATDTPAQPATFARAQAEMRIPQAALQRSYRIGFLRLWILWSDHLSAEGARQGIAPSRVLEAVTSLGSLLFTFQDRALTAVADEYSRVDDALRISGEYLRRTLVSQLLAGVDRPLPTPELSLTLRYDISDTHLAVQIALTDAPRFDDAAGVIRRRCGARSLPYETAEGRRLTWLGRPRWRHRRP